LEKSFAAMAGWKQLRDQATLWKREYPREAYPASEFNVTTSMMPSLFGEHTQILTIGKHMTHW
jgi:hypothetical protein